MYDTIAEPPLLDGATHLTSMLPLPWTTCTPVGAPGTARGVTAVDTTLAEPDPALFAAVTVNV